MPKVSIKLGASINVMNVDHTIDVDQLGKILFSRGSIEWKPFKNSVKQYKFSWREFAKLLEANGRVVADRAAVKKKAAKKKVAKKQAVAATAS